MAKIVLIGAGSRNFSKGIITDVLLYPELRDSTISLMDIDKERLELTADFTRELVKQNGFKTKVLATTDRRKALEGADYVINCTRIGGLEAFKLDIDIPLAERAGAAAELAARQAELWSMMRAEAEAADRELADG